MTTIDVSPGANPTATAGPTAVNGTANTFLRSDGAPAIQLGTNAQKGIVQVDGTTITAAAGVISGAAPANPTATGADTAVNGSAATFMRSDGAPAIQKTSSTLFGLAKVDNQTIIATAGVVSVKQLPGPYTVATLPAGASGDWAYVTDALAPTYGATIAGGGAVYTPVFKNATVWTAR